ncbi:MAG: hypothetical protein ACERKN_11285 [Velocimicrobium sp.]
MIRLKTICEIHKAYSDTQHKLLCLSSEDEVHGFKKTNKINFKHAKKKVNSILAFVLAAIIGFGAGFVTCSTKSWEQAEPIITTADDTRDYTVISE